MEALGNHGYLVVGCHVTGEETLSQEMMNQLQARQPVLGKMKLESRGAVLHQAFGLEENSF